MPKRSSWVVSALLALCAVACGGSEPALTSDGAAATAGSAASGPAASGTGGDATSGAGGGQSTGGASGSSSGANGGSDTASAGGTGSDAGGSTGASGGDSAGSNGGGSAGSSANGGSGPASGGSGGDGGTTSAGGTGAGGSGAGGTGTGGTGTGGAGTGGTASNEPSWAVAYKTDPVNCSTCHGESGEGRATYGPEIQHPSREIFDFIVRSGEAHQLSSYRKPMLPFDTATLSDADANGIFDWLSALPKPTSGAELYADYCSYCHGADGRGGTKDAAYASAYHSAPYRRAGAEFLAYVRAGHVVDDMGMPVPVSERHAYMPPVPPEMLTDAEIQLIEAWLPK